MPVDQALIVTTALLLVPFAVLVAAAARLGYVAGGLATHWKTTRRFVSASTPFFLPGALRLSPQRFGSPGDGPAHDER